MSKQVTKIHSTLDAKHVASLIAGKHFDVSDYKELEKIGIGFDGKALAEMARFAYAMDTIQQPVTTASIAVPVQFLQNWLPGFVKVLTAARKIDEIIGYSTIGSWEDEQIVQPILENLNVATPYGDKTNVPLSNWNVNYNTRNVVRFESGMLVDSLEEARASRARINSGEMKRESCGLALEIQRNMLGFYGYNAGNNNTYGFLNDPNLPSYVQVASGALGRTWAVKTFQEITADIRAAAVAIQTNTQDTIDPFNMEITLAIATAAVGYLSVTTDYGVSVRDWITQTYPKMRIVSAPQLNAANGGLNVFYMFADKVTDLSTDDGRAFIQVVPAKFQLLGVQRTAKGYVEDYANASAGVMTKRPYLIVRYYNI